MSDTNEQRWQQQADLVKTWEERALKAEEQSRMLQDCLQAMMETTGRGVIRVEWRLTPDKEHMFVVASSSKDKLDHLARLVGAAWKGFMDAAEMEKSES